MKIKKIKANSKEELLKDYLDLYAKFKTDISRDFYRKNGVYSEGSIGKFWSGYPEFRKEAEAIYGLGMKEEKKNILLEDEFKKLKKEFNKLELKDSIEERILDDYKECIKSIDLSNLKVSKEIFNRETKKESIFLLSDWHAGEVIKKEEMNGINEFNLKILRNRVDRVFNDFIFHNKEFGITDTHLFMLGDLLAGEIHEELERTNERNVVEVLFIIQELIIEKILLLCEHFNSITIVFIPGNHGRVKKGKPYFKEKNSLNWETILSKQIQNIFDIIQRDNEVKKVKIKVSDSAFSIDKVNGRSFLNTHGDILTKGTGGFAGIPYYSLISTSAKLHGALSQIDIIKDALNKQGIYENQFQDICCGHLHTDAVVNLYNGGKIYMNASLVGTSEFSLFNVKAVSKIIQTMIVVNSYSNVHAVLPIYGEWGNEKHIKK